jgi:phage I-like protein
VELLPDGRVPDWIMLIPAGAEIQTRDGRRWKNPDPAAVLAATREYGLPLPLDFEHATEIAAPQGQPAPAAGWIEALELREGAVWARIAWTPRGAEMLRAREYRFLSPAFLYAKEGGRVIRITSAALTNRPAFPELALNSTRHEDHMDNKTLLAALGLPETATVEQAVAAVNKLKGDLAAATARAQTPDLNLFVPRADYDAQAAKAQVAEKALTERLAAEHQQAAEAAVEAAVKAGKITPATKEFYLATCQTREGLAAFQKFVEAAPVIAGNSGLDGKDPAGAQGSSGLTPGQLAICRQMGLDPKEYQKALA